MFKFLALLATLSLGVPRVFANSPATAFEVNASEAAFLVVTKKEGVASGFAHDHLIAAQNFQVSLQAPEGELEKGSFQFVVKATSLSFDDPALQAKHFEALKAIGVQTEPFSSLSESDRAKVKENAFDESQLDAKKFPEIRAEVSGLKKQPTSFKGKTFSHSAMVKITIKGKTIEKQVPANVSLNEKELTVESVGPFLFSEFGIKPYSAMLGAVRNADAFHFYVSFKARAK